MEEISSVLNIAALVAARDYTRGPSTNPGTYLNRALYRRQLCESSNPSLHVEEYRIAIGFQLIDFRVKRLLLTYHGGTLRFQFNMFEYVSWMCWQI